MHAPVSLALPPRAVKLNGNRLVTGILRGFDQFMNLVLDQTLEHVAAERNSIGMVVRLAMVKTNVPPLAVSHPPHFCACPSYTRLLHYSPAAFSVHSRLQVIRGNSVVMIECLEKL